MQDLIAQLTAGLGINEEQAKGGLGSILSFAKDKLTQPEFSQVKDVLGSSEAEDAMGLASSKAESDGGGLFGAVAGLAGGLGGALGNLGNLASVAKGFKAFGLDADMIAKFLPIAIGFLNAKGGEGVVGLLRKVFP